MSPELTAVPRLSSSFIIGLDEEELLVLLVELDEELAVELVEVLELNRLLIELKADLAAEVSPELMALNRSMTSSPSCEAVESSLEEEDVDEVESVGGGPGGGGGGACVFCVPVAEDELEVLPVREKADSKSKFSALPEVAEDVDAVAVDEEVRLVKSEELCRLEINMAEESFRWDHSTGAAQPPSSRVSVTSVRVL